ncbi:hypothetical protein J6S88_00945 [bacterium]|nr:hypothetical protein [bacterium]
MAYNVYPYSKRDMRALPALPEEMFELPPEPKRGDLEGYLAAKDFASHAYSSCMYSKAQFNIRQLNNLRSDMTAKEYMNILIKQGQVPEKHFKYQKNDDDEIVTEINSYRDVVKKVIFSNSDEKTPIVSRYYNPDSGELVKEIKYHSNGETEIKNFCRSVDDLLAETKDTAPMQIEEYAYVPISRSINPFEKYAG